MDIAFLYSSPHGSTAEIADAMGAVVEQDGHTALVESMTSPQAAQYVELADAVVLGSGVYLGEWTPDAQRFVEENAEGLAAKPLAIFSVGYTGEEPELPEGMNPVVSALLYGRLREGTGWGEDAHDRRDWHEIRSYAKDLPTSLGA